MALIALASAHGSPGVTTLAVALAHRLPLVTGRAAVLIEADPDGGTIAARHSLGGPPALTALAGAARQGLEPAMVLRHTIPMASGVPVVTAHPAAEQSHAALRTAAGHLAAACAVLDDHDVIVDLGRLRPGTPARPFATAAAQLLVLAHPELDQLVAVADRVQALGELAPLHLVLVGDRPYGTAEVRRVLGVETVSVIADDAKAVRADPGAASRRRSAWRASVDRLAAGLSESLAPGEPADDESETEASLRRATALVGDAS